MVNIDKEVNSVIDILEKEQNCYRDMLELSKSKKKVIVEGKVAELDKMVKLEQDMIVTIGQLERKREEAAAKLSNVLGISNAQLTISELAKVLQPELKAGLESVQGKLQQVLSDLKAVNDVNGQLLEQSLDYIDYSINLISGAGMETGSLYEDMGKSKNKQSKKNIFDTKV